MLITKAVCPLNSIVPYKKGRILLVFLSSSKTLPLVIAHEILTRSHLVGKVYTKL
jgi:hypothetical protein